MKKAKKVSCSPLILIPTCYHYLLVALLAGIVYSNTLRADFVYDDRTSSTKGCQQRE
ncbi:Protein CBG26642 [Caenorhabditis briggsae]|uniref:Protein CBG26642 n=1 Tax=Caenorhabditis briggsae TaxID=6238 RepID=B6IE06_CAEBR|nr:Protein CBG26642 [Caenorhabditis briggsae]CAS01070.1 Protein CBG26642 [Caenorhabditis briggsae]